jgi:hypothetical protein
VFNKTAFKLIGALIKQLLVLEMAKIYEVQEMVNELLEPGTVSRSYIVVTTKIKTKEKNNFS